MNSEKAQLSWLRTLLRKLGATSDPCRSRSAMCCCSKVEGQGSGAEESRVTRDSRQDSCLSSCTTALRTQRRLPTDVQLTEADEQHTTAWEVRSESVSLLLGKPQAAGVSNTIIPRGPESCGPDLKQVLNHMPVGRMSYRQDNLDCFH